jgi:hypothetical protein
MVGENVGGGGSVLARYLEVSLGFEVIVIV